MSPVTEEREEIVNRYLKKDQRLKAGCIMKLHGIV